MTVSKGVVGEGFTSGKIGLRSLSVVNAVPCFLRPVPFCAVF